MATLEQRVKFAEKHVTEKSGKSWTTKGRPWVLDEFWRPATGFKLWPRESTLLCQRCSDLVGDIVEYQDDGIKCRRNAMQHGKCKGLKAEPIIMTVLCLPRRSGKTFNTASWVLSQLYQEKYKRIAFVASSEDQMLSLFRENYGEVIKRNKALSRASDVRESQGIIRVPSKRSMFEGLSTSHGSVTGRGRTTVIMDECRDLHPRVAMSLIPSIFESHGWECPNGHLHASAGEEVPKNCPACSTKLRQWFGRILLMSSAGILDGSERDWFSELVSYLQANPSPNVHLFQASHRVNPDISSEITNTVEDVFGSLESTKSYVSVEIENRFTRKGENLLTKGEIDACVDNGLKNRIESDKQCVAFLDTSKTKDKTSLVILSYDEERSIDPWSQVVIERVDVWEPQKLPGGVINPKDILEHLDLYIPLFPNLKALRVDTRVMPWAIALVKQIKKSRPWGRIVDGYHGKRAERKASWQLLHQRMLTRTIRIPPHKELRAELLSVRRVEDLDGNLDVRDANRGKRHIDIADALAVCCYLAHLESITQRRSLTSVSGFQAHTLLQKLYRPTTSKIDLDKF
ncbi:hypothetical protein CMI37_06150 [Candidatus Pacearchaeota archaeon]|nr:hypothetical protein [Candidatus Pacearchaeota archaeon]|tara:strand:+ start:1542 stop:3257 length:1716 start_codon:yes stop_codon:yes gene_type:complete